MNTEYEIAIENHSAFSKGYKKSEEKNKDLIEYLKDNYEYLLKSNEFLKHKNEKLEFEIDKYICKNSELNDTVDIQVDEINLFEKELKKYEIEVNKLIKNNNELRTYTLLLEDALELKFSESQVEINKLHKEI